MFSLLLADDGERVILLDADPDANVASTLGIPRAEQAQITTVAEEVGLIEERTGAKVRSSGQIFTLNPDVSDVAERFAYPVRGLHLLVVGAASRGGGGCACPESTFIRSLVDELVLARDETLLMDMEAGVEHLGRATARSVDAMLVVVEPGVRSVQCGFEIERMCAEIGVERILWLANKVATPDDLDFITSALGERPLIGALPTIERVRLSDRDGSSAYDVLTEEEKEAFRRLLHTIRERLEDE